jgi:hypothetical protein
MIAGGKKKMIDTEGERGGEMGGLEMRVEGTRLEKHNDWRVTWRTRVQDSKGMLLILASEFFGTCMAAAARLLETGDGGGMGTLQVSDISLTSLIPHLKNSSLDFIIQSLEVNIECGSMQTG